MNPKWRGYAPIGLYISLIALLSSVALFVVQREWNLPLQVSLGMVITGLAVFAALDPQRVREILVGRHARYGSNAVIMVLAFTGILVVINYLAYQFPKRIDLTEDKQNSLAPETIETLTRIPEDIFVQAFFTSRMNSEQAKNLLEQFKYNGKGKFDYEFIDPEAKPLIAKQAEVTGDGIVILQLGDRTEQISYVSEQELTGAIIRLMSGEKTSVYFLLGHGEHDPADLSDQGYSRAKDALENKNYIVDGLNLLATNRIPDDARLIIIAGPQQPVTMEEIDIISTFLDEGGSLIVMEDPLILTQFGEADDPLADYLAETWGVELGKNIIVDTSSPKVFFAVANQYGEHEITQKLQGIVTIFPTSRSVTIRNEDSDGSQTELVLTSEQSWGETEMAQLEDENSQVSADASVDLIGPVSVAVAAEKFDPKQRIVVLGDSDFATDVNFDEYGNGRLFLNAVDWAVEKEELINLTAKEPVQRVLLPPQKYTLGLILLGSVFLLPGLILVSGIIVFIQKRKRG